MIGVNLALKEEQAKINAKIEAKVKEIVNKLKISHTKFEDPDFGPSEKDEFGAISLYGATPPDPAGSKYPSPDTLLWQRPQYDDDKFSSDKTAKDAEEEEDEDEKIKSRVISIGLNPLKKKPRDSDKNSKRNWLRPSEPFRT